MKTNHQANYRLVKAVFELYCEENNLKQYINSVMWEHSGFSCTAEDIETGEDRNFRAVDACCDRCKTGGVDYCHACGRSNQIDFEEV